MTAGKQITIAHIITDLDMGGAEKMLSSLVLEMNPARFFNVVISLKDLGYWGPILQQRGILVYALNMRPSVTSIFKLFTLWNILRSLRPDYIQGWMYHANIIASLIGKAAGVTNIFWNIRCSLMDLSKYNIGTTLMFKSGAWLSKMPKLIINNSQASINQHMRAGYKSDKWLYIPNGFDTIKYQPNAKIYQQFRAQHNLPARAIIIAMIARYDPMKDHATFLQAANILASTHPDVYFVFAGNNVNSKNLGLQESISNKALRQRIILLNQINNVQDILPAVDYLTQTSIYGEGFPNILGEAMACGVECFSTDVGDALQLIGDFGYPIPKQDPTAIAAAWSKVIAQDPETKQQRRDAARARIIEMFSISKIVDVYSNCYT